MKKGFEKPNYTQTPNQFFDECMRELNGSELKVTLAIIRKTFGFHKQKARVSLSDLMEITGLSRQAVIDGANGAEIKGMIVKVTDGGVNQWMVKFLDQEESDGSLKSRPPVVQKVDRGSQEIRLPSIKETPKEIVKEDTPNGVPNLHKSMLVELAKVTGFDLKMHGGRLGRSASKLVKAGYLPELVEINYSPGGWWYKNDWRGQKGEMPTPEQIVETIGRIEHTPKVNGHSPQPKQRIILPDGQIVEA